MTTLSTNAEQFYLIEIPDAAHESWWVVGIFDSSEIAVQAFTQRKGRKDSVRLVKCEVIMEYQR
jgi:hypothetical protein